MGLGGVGFDAPSWFERVITILQESQYQQKDIYEHIRQSSMFTAKRYNGSFPSVMAEAEEAREAGVHFWD